MMHKVYLFHFGAFPLFAATYKLLAILISTIKVVLDFVTS